VVRPGRAGRSRRTPAPAWRTDAALRQLPRNARMGASAPDGTRAGSTSERSSGPARARPVPRSLSLLAAPVSRARIAAYVDRSVLQPGQLTPRRRGGGRGVTESAALIRGHDVSSRWASVGQADCSVPTAADVRRRQPVMPRTAGDSGPDHGSLHDQMLSWDNPTPPVVGAGSMAGRTSVRPLLDLHAGLTPYQRRSGSGATRTAGRGRPGGSSTRAVSRASTTTADTA
jgi:hypothetical protein